MTISFGWQRLKASLTLTISRIAFIDILTLPLKTAFCRHRFRVLSPALVMTYCCWPNNACGAQLNKM
ncbi:MAG: hypothetical protein CMF19_05730, partial [Idiomarinaceae bacterium]|nr:hypothetical protein [Idiomarinaceae bacterium]